jgi:hypothetical protein
MSLKNKILSHFSVCRNLSDCMVIHCFCNSPITNIPQSFCSNFAVLLLRILLSFCLYFVVPLSGIFYSLAKHSAVFLSNILLPSCLRKKNSLYTHVLIPDHEKIIALSSSSANFENLPNTSVENYETAACLLAPKTKEYSFFSSFQTKSDWIPWCIYFL